MKTNEWLADQNRLKKQKLKTKVKILTQDVKWANPFLKEKKTIKMQKADTLASRQDSLIKIIPSIQNTDRNYIPYEINAQTANLFDNPYSPNSNVTEKLNIEFLSSTDDK